jgi:hypothetical protein
VGFSGEEGISHMINSGQPSTAARPPLTARQLVAVLAATLAVCALLLGWTIGQQPILGDESHHFHKAVSFFEAPWSEMRLDHDPAYPASGECAIRYWDASLWHLGLATIWKVLGQPWPFAAQLYQVAFLLMLGLLTFLAGRELYGTAGGWWAWALVMSLPMNLLLGMVFYLELPAAAMTALAVYAILRRRPLLLAFGLAGMFYMKIPSAAVLVGPLALAAAFYLGDTWRRRVGRTALAFSAAFLLLLPDLVWRMAHFNGQPLIFYEDLAPLPQWICAQLPPSQEGAIPMNILDPVMAVGTLGLPGLVALVAAAAWGGWLLGRALLGMARRVRSAGLRAMPAAMLEGLHAEVLVAAIPLLAFIVAYAVLLRINHDVRYFYPAMFFACLLGGGLLARANPLGYLGPCRRLAQVAAGLLLLAMIGQTLTTPFIIHQRRTLPPGVAAGFGWIRQHTPPGARIIYPEFNLVTLTGRPIIWAVLVPRYFFSVSEPQQMRLLIYLDVQYIALPPNRFVAKAMPTTESMGYPIDWARSLSQRPYLTRVYPDHAVEPESGEFVLYRIDRDRIPPEWLAKPLFDYGKDDPQGRPGGPS